MWFSLGSEPSMLATRGMSPLSRILYLQSLPWRDSWCLDIHHLLRKAPSNHRTIHEYLHKSKTNHTSNEYLDNKLIFSQINTESIWLRWTFQNGTHKFRKDCTYSDWWLNILDITLLNKNLLCSLTQSLYFSFFDVFTLFELLNPLIKVLFASRFSHSLVKV